MNAIYRNQKRAILDVTDAGVLLRGPDGFGPDLIAHGAPGLIVDPTDAQVVEAQRNLESKRALTAIASDIRSSADRLYDLARDIEAAYATPLTLRLSIGDVEDVLDWTRTEVVDPSKKNLRRIRNLDVVRS